MIAAVQAAKAAADGRGRCCRPGWRTAGAAQEVGAETTVVGAHMQHHGQEWSRRHAETLPAVQCVCVGMRVCVRRLCARERRPRGHGHHHDRSRACRVVASRTIKRSEWGWGMGRGGEVRRVVVWCCGSGLLGGPGCGHGGSAQCTQCVRACMHAVGRHRWCSSQTCTRGLVGFGGTGCGGHWHHSHRRTGGGHDEWRRSAVGAGAQCT